MSIPLRELEQHFRELQYYLRNGLASRVKLDLINRFISNLAVQDNPHRYLSYFQEIYEDFLGLLEPENLQFRSTDFLTDLDNQVQLMKQAGLNEVSDPDYREYHENLRYQQIAACWYTGDRYGLELLTGIKIQHESGVDPYDVLSRILSDGKFKDQKNIEIFEKISQNWQNDALGWSRDTVWIPLVEQETTQNFGRIEIATLQPLRVDVEARRHGADMDLIFFNNHPLSVGDPVYDQALDAVGAAKKHLKIRKQGKIPKFRIMFGFPDKQYFYTGESFGLGMSLAVLAQMEKVLIQRNQHQIAQNAVITGGIDILGQVRGVSEQSLPAKLAAFYYSPFQTFVYPEINTGVVEKSLDELVKGRKLKVKSQRSKVESNVEPMMGNQSFLTIPTSQLPNLLTSRRVVQKQSISIKALSQAHIRKSQVMRYVAAILLLAGIGWGSWWFSRNLNPVSYEVKGGLLSVFNQEEKLLWSKQVVPYSLADAFHAKDKRWRLQIFDINSDGNNEILLVPRIDNPRYDGFLTCKDSKGKDLWKLDLNETMYFGDDAYSAPFSISRLKVFRNSDNQVEIIASLFHFPWFPSKISRVSADGVELSAYYHSGHIVDLKILDLTGDGKMDILFSGTNNENRSAIIGAIEQSHLRGHSPQQEYNYLYKDSFEADHIFYMRLPKSDWLDMGNTSDYFAVHHIEKAGDGGFLATVQNIHTGYEVIYTFSKELKLISASPTDLMMYKYLKLHGHSMLDDYSTEYIYEKLSAIKSWDGKKWVDFKN